jgi:hypothetical protein
LRDGGVGRVGAVRLEVLDELEEDDDAVVDDDPEVEVELLLGVEVLAEPEDKETGAVSSYPKFISSSFERSGKMMLVV